MSFNTTIFFYATKTILLRTSSLVSFFFFYIIRVEWDIQCVRRDKRGGEGGDGGSSVWIEHRPDMNRQSSLFGGLCNGWDARYIPSTSEVTLFYLFYLSSLSFSSYFPLFLIIPPFSWKTTRSHIYIYCVGAMYSDLFFFPPVASNDHLRNSTAGQWAVIAIKCSILYSPSKFKLEISFWKRNQTYQVTSVHDGIYYNT